MSMKKIYLAGPMDQVSAETMMGWRGLVADYLKPLIDDGMVKLLDPTRRPHQNTLTFKEIYNLDLMDVRNCDMILADTRYSPRETWGTSAEIFYASEILRKPVIGWKGSDPCGFRRVFLDVMVWKQFEDLQEAVNHLQEQYI